MKEVIDKIKNNKNLIVLSSIVIILVIVLVVGITYAYLQSQITRDGTSDVNVGTSTTDILDFSTGDALTINVSDITLAEGEDNLYSTTTATASLTANNATNSATYTYDVYFQISNNTLTYSDGSTPEVILTIIDPNGAEVTSITGLTYYDADEIVGFTNYSKDSVSGFDLTGVDTTESNVTFVVYDDYEITSSSSSTAVNQVWTFTLTYLNLDIEQSINLGNSMSISVIMSDGKKS